MGKLADFERCEIGYLERLGEPDEFTSSLGLVSIGFNLLEREVSEAIHELLRVEKNMGKAVTAGLSFRKKIDLLSSLYKEIKEKDDLKLFNRKDVEEETVNELIKLLFKCNQLRNKLIHSVYLSRIDNKITREKTSARATTGLKIVNEEIEVSYLLDVYDFIVSTSMYVEDYFILKKVNQQTDNL